MKRTTRSRVKHRRKQARQECLEQLRSMAEWEREDELRDWDSLVLHEDWYDEVDDWWEPDDRDDERALARYYESDLEERDDWEPDCLRDLDIALWRLRCGFSSLTTSQITDVAVMASRLVNISETATRKMKEER